MVKALLAALAALVLAGCAMGVGNVRACYAGSHGMICGGGQGSTGQMGGGYPPPHYRYQGGGQYFGQPMYVPPPILYQPQIPPPTLFMPVPVVPMPRTGPCVGYRLVPHVGYVCQGYQYGFEVPKTDWMVPDIQVAPLDRQQGEEDFLAFRDVGPT